MTERVTDVVLSNGASVHVYGTREEIRTKFEACLAARTIFCEVEMESFGKEPKIKVTLNINQVTFLMPDHDAKSHHGGEATPPVGHAVL